MCDDPILPSYYIMGLHHAYHLAAAEVKHTSLYTSASLTAVDSAPARAPTVEELVKHLRTELQAQRTAAGQAAAAESATLPISHSGQAILASEGRRQKNLIARLRKAKHTTNRLVLAFLARLRKVDVHSYAPMTTSVRTALNAS